MLADTDRARDALQSIPPDLPREDWVRAGMAAQAAGLDFDTFNDWSAAAGNTASKPPLTPGAASSRAGALGLAPCTAWPQN